MTTYYIELFQFANDADISKISTNTLKEVINDFTKELNNRCTEQNLNIHSVSGKLAYYQLCPKCFGEGIVPNYGISTTALLTRICPTCNGAKTFLVDTCRAAGL